LKGCTAGTGSGEVEFEEFEAWWMNNPAMAKRAKEREATGLVALRRGGGAAAGGEVLLRSVRWPFFSRRCTNA
jgi:hypothetical protein